MTALKTTFKQLNNGKVVNDPIFLTRLVVLLVMVGFFLAGTPAFAQGPGGDLGNVISELVNNITDLIQSVAIGAGILGLSIWGIGKVARPVFPQISQLTANYIPDLLIGVAVVFVAASIVEGIAGAIGGGS